jgi:hypothetical protein
MAAAPLGPPPAHLSVSEDMPVLAVPAGQLHRISRYPDNEPFFSTSGANRFDAPGCRAGRAEFATCYLGYSLAVAIAETLLHDEEPVDGRFAVSVATLRTRYVHRFYGRSPLRLMNITGAPLKRLGAHAELAGTTNYAMTQRWALAVFNNPLQVDGFIYMSRHLNDQRAVILFDRARPRIRAYKKTTPLHRTPGFAAAGELLGIVAA